MSNRLDKERGPLCETSLDQKRMAVLLLVCEWSRVCMYRFAACLLCAVATPRVVYACVRVGVWSESRAGQQRRRQHQTHGAAADGATLSRAEEQGRCWRQRERERQRDETSRRMGGAHTAWRPRPLESRV